MNTTKWLKVQKIMGLSSLLSIPVVSLGNPFLMLILIYPFAGTVALSFLSSRSVRNLRKFYDSRMGNRPILIQITTLILAIIVFAIFIIMANEGVSWDGHRVTNVYVDSIVATYFLIFTVVVGLNLYVLISKKY